MNIKPGSTTSEYIISLMVVVLNALIGVAATLTAQWGITIDPEIVSAIILANFGAAGAYAAGRAHVKSKQLTAPPALVYGSSGPTNTTL